MRFSTTAVIIATCMIGTVLAHEHHEISHAVKEACLADRNQFCEGKRLHKCMKKHWNELSTACTDAIEEMRSSHHNERKHSDGGDHDHDEHHDVAEAVQVACAADKETFCAGKEGKGARKCMKKHWNELSTACTDAIEEMRSSHHNERKHSDGGDHDHDEHHDEHHEVAEAVQVACAADKEMFCAGKEGKGLRKCMKKHHSDLSEPCATAIADAHRGHCGVPDAVKTACASDKEALCGGKHGGEVHKCMKKHWDEVSALCRDAVTAWKSSTTNAPTAPSGATELSLPTVPVEAAAIQFQAVSSLVEETHTSPSAFGTGQIVMMGAVGAVVTVSVLVAIVVSRRFRVHGTLVTRSYVSFPDLDSVTVGIPVSV